MKVMVDKNVVWFVIIVKSLQISSNFATLISPITKAVESARRPQISQAVNIKHLTWASHYRRRRQLSLKKLRLQRQRKHNTTLCTKLISITLSQPFSAFWLQNDCELPITNCEDCPWQLKYVLQ